MQKRKNIKNVIATLTLTLLIGSSFPWINDSFLKPIGLTKLDAVSHATGGGGSITPPRPQEETNDPAGNVSSADKALPLTDDFVTGVTYNNDYGYAIMEINQDKLNGGFVNQIQHIGIGSKKYTYRTVNKDRSNWFRIFVPYKFLPESGQEDFYFYMGDKTYHYKLHLKSPYDRSKKLVPTLVPEETTPGTNKTIKLKVSYDKNYDINAWYDSLKKENLSVISNFTMSSLRTDETKQVESMDIDRTKNIISVKFKPDYHFYNFYVHEFIFNSDKYVNGYSYLVLYDEAPELGTNWSTSGDYSLNIDDKSHGVYLGELTKVTLTNNKTKEAVKLKENEDYFATWSNLNIKSSVFESNTSYTITLESSKTATKTLNVTSPDIPKINATGYIDIDDIEHDGDLKIKVKDSEWLKKVRDITLENRNGREFPLSIDNDDFTVNQADNTITVSNSKLENWTGNWKVTIPVKGYENTYGTFFHRPEKGYFTDSSAPRLAAEWASNGTFRITVPDDKYSSYMLNNYQVNLIDVTTGKVTPLYRSTKKETGDYPNNYSIILKRKFFEKDKKYKIRVISRGYNSSLIDVPDMGDREIKVATADAPSFLEHTPLKINSENADWLNAVNKITVTDSRGYSTVLTSADWIRDGKTISVGYDKLEDKLRFLPGSLDLTIEATDYEDVELSLQVQTPAPTAKYTPRGDSAHISFGNSAMYGYSDTIQEVKLNDDVLSTTQYTKEALGTGINISNRYLLDGENTVTVKNSKYAGESKVTFAFDNKELRDTKEDLLEILKGAYLPDSQKDAYKDKINNAKTLDEVIAAGLALKSEDTDSEARELINEKIKVVKKINLSQLPADKVSLFKGKLDEAKDKNTVSSISREVDNAIKNHFTDLKDTLYDEIDETDKASSELQPYFDKLDDAKTVDDIKAVKKEFYKFINKEYIDVASMKMSNDIQKVVDKNKIQPSVVTLGNPKSTIDAALTDGLMLNKGALSVNGSITVNDWAKDENSRLVTSLVTVTNSDGSKDAKILAVTVVKVISAKPDVAPIQEAKPEFDMSKLDSKPGKQPQAQEDSKSQVKSKTHIKGKRTAPKTGDSDSAGIYLSVLGLSVFSILALKRKWNN